mmetsp:Transcript_49548/g.97574  ORF Transcript_49548/g.97574 Transcript_49548/m.97574 type:complete len:85 (-) Transcript_49548:650-904(-)
MKLLKLLSLTHTSRTEYTEARKGSHSVGKKRDVLLHRIAWEELLVFREKVGWIDGLTEERETDKQIRSCRQDVQKCHCCGTDPF